MIANIMEDVNVDSLWLIDKRDSSGKHANVYHGNFVPQIPNNLIRRYTKEGDIVLDLFMGSGTTLFECESLKRDFIGFDINKDIIEYVNSKMDRACPIKYFVNNCDVTDEGLFSKTICDNFKILGKNKIDFFIAHPPYLDIIKFTNLKYDLSNISDVNDFISKFIVSINNAYKYLEPNKYFAIVVGDIYRNSEVVPLAFYAMDSVKKHFNVKLKGIVIKNIEGNKGKLGVDNIWHSRALRSDYFIFKHEYIFVFKKLFK
jgi:DNA modification methylase